MASSLPPSASYGVLLYCSIPEGFGNPVEGQYSFLTPTQPCRALVQSPVVGPWCRVPGACPGAGPWYGPLEHGPVAGPWCRALVHIGPVCTWAMVHTGPWCRAMVHRGPWCRALVQSPWCRVPGAGPWCREVEHEATAGCIPWARLLYLSLYTRTVFFTLRRLFTPGLGQLSYSQ
jgi:hypothetical protein